jgi:DNA-binding transcriptional LysR family regulator
MSGELATDRLAAFYETARLKSFTRAAARLHVSQSALSQRVHKLEEELGATLFVRGTDGIRLTETGLRLLRYCQAKDQLDAELLRDLKEPAIGDLAGPLRVAAYSSVLRSAVLPALTPLLRGNPAIRIEFQVHQTSALPRVLREGAADFIVLDRKLAWSDVTALPLGRERYVVIESARRAAPADIYLDNDPDDDVTRWFFAGRPDAPDYRRVFMCDVYGILDGVAQGLGRAVVPRHLVRRGSGVRMIDSYSDRHVDVVLHHYTVAAPASLHKQVVAALVGGCGRHLESD